MRGSHSTASGDRRRRLLNESARTEIDSAQPARGRKRQTSTGYAAEAIDASPCLADWLHRGFGSIFLLMLAMAAVIAALTAGDYYRPRMATVLPAETLSVLVAASPGSLARWFVVVLLLASAVWAFGIYTLRRHKLDDYRARYRVWLGLALFLFAWSAQIAAPWDGLWSAIWVWQTGETGGPLGHWWWQGPVLLIGAVLTIRMLIDIRQTKLTVAALIAALSCWGLTAAFSAEALTVDPIYTQLALVALPLSGYAMLLLMLLLAGRYVVLDAAGAVKPKTKAKRAPKPKQKQQEEADAESHAASQKRSRETHPTAKTDQPAATAPAEETGTRKLSKAERKRLRKERARQRKAA